MAEGESGVSELFSALSLSAKSTSQNVILIDDLASLEKHKSLIADENLLALDCEGIHLGRLGKLSVVQLATLKFCFLFDMLKESTDSSVVCFLKKVLENESVVKIVHDCRADSDALYHLFGITLRGIHDTQSWQMTLHPLRGRLNLNDTLTLFGCPINGVRNTTVYKSNPSFWALRPFTKQMIAWASEDVITLFPLHAKQLAAADSRTAAKCIEASARHANEFRTASVQIVRIHTTQIGNFIGKHGANIHSLERATGAKFHVRHGGEFVVYAADEATLACAVVACRPFTLPFERWSRRGRYDSDVDF